MALIYLFEDDPNLRGLLVEMLRDELNADVQPCGSMAELRRRCTDQRPDLIVADFWGTSHLQLDDTERAEITALAAIAPLVLVSARNWAMGAEPNELGVVALLPKPLDIELFATVIEDALAQTHMPRGLEDEQATDVIPHEAMSVFVLGWPQA